MHHPFNFMCNGMIRQFKKQNCTINIMGNNNSLMLINCNVMINLMGNSNQIFFVKTQGRIVLNGNNNHIKIENTKLNLGMNGNNNQIFNNGSNNIVKEFMNGVGNKFYESNSTQHNHEVQRQQDQLSNQYQLSREDQYSSERQEQQPISQNYHGSRYDFNQQSSSQQEQQQESSHSRSLYQFDIHEPIQRMLRVFVPHHSIQHSSQHSSSINRRQQSQGDEESNQSLFLQQELNLFPTREHQGKSKSCTICLQRVQHGELTTTLFCFHEFHNKCIRTWLFKSKACPICKLDLKKQLFKHMNS